MRIVLKDNVSSAERNALIAPLLAHNAAQGVDFTDSPFALALEDDGDNVVGGVLATPAGAGCISPQWRFQQSYAGKAGGAD
jgi:hypothetical protein